MLRARLDCRKIKGNPKEYTSSVLLTSEGVWIGGMNIPVPPERLPSLHKTQEQKHPLQPKVLADARGETNVRAEKQGLKKLKEANSFI